MICALHFAKPLPVPRGNEMTRACSHVETQAEEEVAPACGGRQESFSQAGRRSRNNWPWSTSQKQTAPDLGCPLLPTNCALQKQVKLASGEVGQKHVVSVAIDPKRDRRRKRPVG